MKNKVKQKYEEFYPMARRKLAVVEQSSKEEFMNASYGIKRLQGMVKFMMSEDWSNVCPNLESI